MSRGRRLNKSLVSSRPDLKSQCQPTPAFSVLRFARCADGSACALATVVFGGIEVDITLYVQGRSTVVAPTPARGRASVRLTPELSQLLRAELLERLHSRSDQDADNDGNHYSPPIGSVGRAL